MKNMVVTQRIDKEVEVEPLIYRHLAWMRLSNKRRTTIYARERTLIRLSVWAQGPILYLNAGQLSQWQADLAAGHNGRKPLSSASVRVLTAHVREFYRWACREQLITDDPTTRLVTPASVRGLPHPMSDELLDRAMESAEPRIAAVLALARYSGLRACEIARLDWDDLALNERQPSLTVREGKGGHSRRVTVPDELRDVLLTLPHRQGAVIRRQDGAEGYNTAPRVSQIAARHLHECGAGPKETLHSLRHYFASAAYRADQDLRAIQEELGHRSVATTQIYAQVGDEARRHAVVAGAKVRLQAS